MSRFPYVHLDVFTDHPFCGNQLAVFPGRFRRNRSGEVTHFVYYEFGERPGIARKITASAEGR